MSAFHIDWTHKSQNNHSQKDCSISAWNVFSFKLKIFLKLTFLKLMTKFCTKLRAKCEFMNKEFIEIGWVWLSGKNAIYLSFSFISIITNAKEYVEQKFNWSFISCKGSLWITTNYSDIIFKPELANWLLKEDTQLGNPKAHSWPQMLSIFRGIRELQSFDSSSIRNKIWVVLSWWWVALACRNRVVKVTAGKRVLQCFSVGLGNRVWMGFARWNWKREGSAPSVTGQSVQRNRSWV